MRKRNAFKPESLGPLESRLALSGVATTREIAEMQGILARLGTSTAMAVGRNHAGG